MEKEISKETIYNGRVFDVESYDIETCNGSKSKRDIVKKSPAVVVLGLKTNKKIILIRQYRFAIKEYVYELPAGFIEKNEKPCCAASREFREETGYEINNLTKLIEFYTSPGFTNELLTLYQGEVGKLGETSFDEDENIETFEFTLSEIKTMISEGKISDGKTILGIYLYESLAKG